MHWATHWEESASLCCRKESRPRKRQLSMRGAHRHDQQYGGTHASHQAWGERAGTIGAANDRHSCKHRSREPEEFCSKPECKTNWHRFLFCCARRAGRNPASQCLYPGMCKNCAECKPMRSRGCKGCGTVRALVIIAKSCIHAAATRTPLFVLRHIWARHTKFVCACWSDLASAPHSARGEHIIHACTRRKPSNVGTCTQLYLPCACAFGVERIGTFERESWHIGRNHYALRVAHRAEVALLHVVPPPLI